MRTSLKWSLVVLTAVVTLALPVIGNFAAAQSQPEPSGYTCTQPEGDNCWFSSGVPCSTATCGNWQFEFGTIAPMCPDGPQKHAPYYNCTPDQQMWRTCANVNSLDGQCSLAWMGCGNYKIYLQMSDCMIDEGCGEAEMGYCYASAPDQCY